MTVNARKAFYERKLPLGFLKAVGSPPRHRKWIWSVVRSLLAAKIAANELNRSTLLNARELSGESDLLDVRCGGRGLRPSTGRDHSLVL